MVLQLDNVDGTENFQPEWGRHVPVIRRYTPSIERWRTEVEANMPESLRRRPDASQLVDKYLWTMSGENAAGDPTIFHDGGNGYGLMADRVSRTPPSSPPDVQIRNGWNLVQANPKTWTDWGEGSSYQGKPFGALGVIAPYDPDPAAVHPTQGGTSRIRPPNTGDAAGDAGATTMPAGWVPPTGYASSSDVPLVDKLRIAREKRLRDTGYIPPESAGDFTGNLLGTGQVRQETYDKIQAAGGGGGNTGLNIDEVMKRAGLGGTDYGHKITGAVRSAADASLSAASDVFSTLSDTLPFPTLLPSPGGGQGSTHTLPEVATKSLAPGVTAAAGDVGAALGAPIDLLTRPFSPGGPGGSPGRPTPGVASAVGRFGAESLAPTDPLNIALMGEPLLGKGLEAAGAAGRAGVKLYDEAAIRLAANETFDRLAPAALLRPERAGAAIAQEAAGLPIDPRSPFARTGAAAGFGPSPSPLVYEARQGGAAAGRAAGPEVAGGGAGRAAYANKMRAEYVAALGEEKAATLEQGLAAQGLTWADYGDAREAFALKTPSWNRDPGSASVTTGFKGDPNNPADVVAAIQQAVADVRAEKAGTGARAQMEAANARRGGARTGRDAGADVGGGTAGVPPTEPPPEPPPSTAQPRKGQKATTLFPSAGEVVDGRVVRGDVPNMGSISATFDEGTYDVLPGIRQVPLSTFDPAYVAHVKEHGFGGYSADQKSNVEALSNAIKASGEINPLIVAVDKEGPYILEGQSRFDALIRNDAQAVPAVVVVEKGGRPDAFLPDVKPGRGAAVVPEAASAAAPTTNEARVAGARAGRQAGDEVGGGAAGVPGAAAPPAPPAPPAPADPTSGPIAAAIKGLGRELASTPGAALSTVASWSPQLGRQGLPAFFMNPRRTLRNLGTSLKAGTSEAEGVKILEASLADDWIRSTKEADSAAKAAYDAAYAKAGPVWRANNKPPIPGGSLPHAGYSYQDVGGAALDWRGTGPLEGKPLKELEAIAAKNNIDLPKNVTAARAREQIARDLRPELLEGLSQDTKVGRAAEWFTRPSSRQSAVELNLYRFDWYKGAAQHMWDAGERDVKAYEDLRKTVEVFTQRGAWKQPFSFPAFFSTRAMSARVQMIGQGLDAMAHFPDMFKPGSRQEAGKALLALTAGNLTMMAGLYGAASAAGLQPKIETDGKLPTLTVGDAFHFDPWAGINTPARAIFGVVADTLAAPSVADAPQAALQSAATRTQKLLRGGLSPIFGKLADTATGRDFTGQKYNLKDDILSGGLITDLVAPMLVSSAKEGFTEGGVAGAAATTVPSSLSFSVNAYMRPEDVANRSSRDKYGQEYNALSRDDRIAVFGGLPDQQRKPLEKVERKSYESEVKKAGLQDYWSSDDKAQFFIAHPELETQAWYFDRRTIQNVDTVDKVLAMNVPGREVRFQGLQVDIGRDDKTRAAWDASKDIIQEYTHDIVSDENKDTTARRMYHRNFSDLPKDAQRDVVSNIRNTFLERDPEANAWMYWWGRSAKTKTATATRIAEGLKSEFGPGADSVGAGATIGAQFSEPAVPLPRKPGTVVQPQKGATSRSVTLPSGRKLTIEEAA